MNQLLSSGNKRNGKKLIEAKLKKALENKDKSLNNSLVQSRKMKGLAIIQVDSVRTIAPLCQETKIPLTFQNKNQKNQKPTGKTTIQE